MSRGTQILNLIVARLRMISPAQGYQTKVHAVHRGAELDQLKDDDPLPVIAVFTLSDQELARNGADSKCERRIVIEAMLDGPDGESQADALLRDVRRVLTMGAPRVLDGLSTKLTLDPAEFILPATGGALTLLKQTLSVQYVESYQ